MKLPKPWCCVGRRKPEPPGNEPRPAARTTGSGTGPGPGRPPGPARGLGRRRLAAQAALEAKRAVKRRHSQAAAARRPAPAPPAPCPAQTPVPEAEQRARANTDNRASYQRLREGVTAGEPAAIAAYVQRLARHRQRNAAKARKLPLEQRSEIAKQAAAKRWGKRK